MHLSLVFNAFPRTRSVLNDHYYRVTHSTSVDPLESRDNYTATSNTMKLVHWPLTGGLSHLEGTGQGPSPPRPILAVHNVTAHPSTANVPITVLLYNGTLLCGFNAGIKGFFFFFSYACHLP